MRRGQISPFRGLGIRKKLLLGIVLLLVVSAALSLILHQEETHHAQEEAAEAVERLVGRLAKGDPGLSDSALADAGVDAADLSPEVVRPGFRVGPEGWTLILEHGRTLTPTPENLEELEREGFESAVVLPPPGTTVIDELRDPIEAAREASLPRELTIAGLVLLFGSALTWLVAGRLIRPLHELRRSMEAVARGELDVSLENLPATDSAGRGDEIAQMSIAFRSMVESLREKREMEKKVFQAERSAALGDLAAGVAHDVRNPLNAVGLSLGHLRDSCGPTEPSRRESFERILDDAKSELGRLDELVHNFLSLASDKSGAREQTGERRLIDPRELVEDSLALVRKQAETQGGELDVELEECGAVDVDSLEMRRAITNVLVNSLQAIDVLPEEDSPESSRGIVEVRLELTRRSSAELARLSVRDSGRGMTAEESERAFLPYYSTRESGTGLGLPITRGIVESHGGEIRLESTPGQGTLVEILLPKAVKVAELAGVTR